jgi:leucyl-tRNA synthetase
MEKYNHIKIEKKWQKKWTKDNLYKVSDNQDKPKYYILDMFPYPSGAGLHVGHPKGYIATDVFARTKMMQGFNVLHPMGWDAFGLPAENYALTNKVHPRVATEKNVATYKRQLEMLGFSYDWSREINTTDPEFYKWTQWIFLKMFEKGLACESYEPINWCPSCKTGLANEDLEGGKCERCGSDVEQKPMRQWVLKITDYADRLLNDLEKLPEWEESIKEMQKNWIGRSEGATVKFSVILERANDSERSDRISGSYHPSSNSGLQDDNVLEVFTTRPDTLFGATFFVLAPEHPFVEKIATNEQKKEVEKYVKNASKKTEMERTELAKEKTGVFTGVYVINPVNNEKIPVWIADYVMMGYGTGAIMAVPAHDERDFEFAIKYNIPIKKVVETKNTFIVAITKSLTPEFYNEVSKFAKIETGTESWDGLTIIHGEDVDKVFESAKEGFVGGPWYIHSEGPVKKILIHAKNNENKIFDWSKQDEYKNAYNFGIQSGIAAKQLDFVGPYAAFCEAGKNINSDFLNDLETSAAKEKMISWLEEKKLGKRAVNYKLKDWVFSRQRYWGEPIPLIHCAKCGVVPVPENELPLKLPEVEHYEPTGTGESPLANIYDWVNTICPKCGGVAKRETNTMPQWAGSSWYYLRYIDPHNDKALVDKDKEKYWSPIDFYVGGAEHATRHLIYARFWHKFLFDIGAVNYEEPFTRLQHVGLILAEDGRKMSKRWNNVINPDEIVAEYGADAMRVYEMFMGPFSQATAWNTNGLIGARKFLEKVRRTSEKIKPDIENKKIENLLHKTIKKIGEDIEAFKLNTAVSAMMILANAMDEESKVDKNVYENFIKILSPFAPHLTEEIWNELGHQESVFKENWPKYNPELARDEKIELAIQINGKLRDTIKVAVDIDEAEAKKVVMESEKIKKWLEGKEIVKVIFVKGRLVNVVSK